MNAQPDVNALLAQIETLQAKLTEQATAKITLKVGEKGTVCLYYGSRYPIPLYAEQWERVIPFIKTGAVEQFIATNAALISRRPPKA